MPTLDYARPIHPPPLSWKIGVALWVGIITGTYAVGAIATARNPGGELNELILVAFAGLLGSFIPVVPFSIATILIRFIRKQHLRSHPARRAFLLGLVSSAVCAAGDALFPRHWIGDVCTLGWLFLPTLCCSLLFAPRGHTPTFIAPS